MHQPPVCVWSGGGRSRHRGLAHDKADGLANLRRVHLIPATSQQLNGGCQINRALQPLGPRALNLALAVAAGEPVLGGPPCEQGDVLYLALEDNRRRLKDRINIVRPFSKKRAGLDRLRLQTEAPRIDAGLIDELERWRKSAKNPRMIVIDVRYTLP